MARKWTTVRGKFSPEDEAEIAQQVEAESVQVTVGDARGVFYDLFPEEEAARLTEKARLLSAIMAQARAAGMSKGKLVGIFGSAETFEKLERGKLRECSMEELREYAKRLNLPVPAPSNREQ